MDRHRPVLRPVELDDADRGHRHGRLVVLRRPRVGWLLGVGPGGERLPDAVAGDTALLHSALAQRRRDVLPVWNLSLAVAAFLLASLGSFLTRSGLVASVHSFAGSSVGPVLLGFLAALVVGVAVLVALRADRLGSPGEVGPLVSRGAALLVNNLLLVCVAVTILVGTLFPLLAQWFSGADLSVGGPYFDRTAVPVLVLLLFLMAVGPFLSWRGDPLTVALSRLVLPLCVGAATVTVLALYTPREPSACWRSALPPWSPRARCSTAWPGSPRSAGRSAEAGPGPPVTGCEGAGAAQPA